MGKIAEKRKDRESKLRESESESCHRLLGLKHVLVKQARVDKVLRGVIEQSVSAFDGFVSRLGRELINLF